MDRDNPYVGSALEFRESPRGRGNPPEGVCPGGFGFVSVVRQPEGCSHALLNNLNMVRFPEKNKK